MKADADNTTSTTNTKVLGKPLTSTATSTHDISRPLPMSAPSIPNLLSSRPRNPPNRTRPPRLPPSTPHLSQSSAAADAAVLATDTDAAQSRLSAVQARYLVDDFASAFAGANASNVLAPRRLPIINRGTYVRTMAIDELVIAFLGDGDGWRKDGDGGREDDDDDDRGNLATPRTSTRQAARDDNNDPTTPPAPEPRTTPPRRQIISLGAGTDTRYWRFRSQNRLSNVTYHEIDFPIQTHTKLERVRADPRLLGPRNGDDIGHLDGLTVLRVQNAEGRDTDDILRWGFAGDGRGDGDGYGSEYWNHALDLRHLADLVDFSSTQSNTTATNSTSHTTGQTRASAMLSTLSPNTPTLIISECCLCYLSPSDAHGVLSTLQAHLPSSLGIILYEPLHPSDDFGRMMKRNLGLRNLTMPTVEKFPDAEAQKNRLLELGFRGAQTARTVVELWSDRSEAERARIDGLERLDEVEEWSLLGSHYAVVWAWRGPLYPGEALSAGEEGGERYEMGVWKAWDVRS